MKDKIKQILDLLKEEDTEVKQKILLECATKIGTREWADAVKDLWKRMEKLKEKN